MLKRIARILLSEFAERLAEKGVQIEITDALVDFLAEKGYDPKFGARPMRRVLQDTIEHSVARKMIAGEIVPGASIQLNTEDFE